MTVRGVVLFPGAGSSADHISLVSISAEIFPIPNERIDFPYRKAGRKFPDKAPVLVQYVKDEVRRYARGIGCSTSQIAIGGRSMGGRMCTMAIADENDPLEVAGVVCVAYPLHPPKKPEQLRTEHLPRVQTQSLFISGTRDEFGSPTELREAFTLLPNQPTVKFIEGAGHDLRGHNANVGAMIKEWLLAL